MASQLLFHSTFGNNVQLAAPSQFGSSGAWQNLLGTDLATGYSWPPSLWGITNGNQAGLQMLTGFSVTASTIGNYIQNQIQSVSDPTLPSGVTSALYQAVLQKTPGTVTQDPLVFAPPQDPGDVYISEYLKFSDLSSQLIAGGTSNWHLFFEWKTGGQGVNYGGDYRLASYVIKNNNGSLYWHVDGDNVADGGLTPQTFWTADSTVPVPTNQWFHFEVFWHRAGDNTGHVWEAINGQTIVDHFGPNMGVNNDPVNRIMVSTPYADVPVQQSVTDLQIWNGMPGATAPVTVSSVVASPATGDVTVGNTVTLTLAMSAPVTVTGGPTLTLNDGGVATYDAAHSTATSLVFDYTVAAGQNTPALAVTGVTLNGGAVQDSSGASADLSGADVTFAGLQIGTIAPTTVTSIVASPATGDITSGNMVTLTLAMSAAVTVTGSPTLTLNDGGVATYDAAHSTATSLVFDYTVAAGQNTPALAVTGAALNGGTVLDGAGHAADLSGADVTFTGLQIGGTAPPAPSAPSIGNMLGATGASNTTNLTNPVFTGTAAPQSTVTLFDGKTQVGLGQANAQGNWTITSSALSVGTHSMTATATANGVVSAASPVTNLTVTSSTSFNLGNANAVLQLGNQNNTVVFTNGSVVVLAGNGNDTIQGGNGNDILYLGNGSDRITLGSGSDTVKIGSGRYTVSGGSGPDQFIFTAPQGVLTTPFGSTDELVFSSAGFNLGLGGGSTPQPLPASLFSTANNGTFSAGSSFAYSQSNGDLYYRSSPSASRTLVADLTNKPHLAAANLFFTS